MLKKITINQLNFLVKLFDDYRTTLYERMNMLGHKMESIMEFINGYTLVLEYAYDHVVNDLGSTGFDPENLALTATYYNCNEMIASIDKIAKIIDGDYKSCYTEWEIIGIKYAICLAKFYTENVLFGDHKVPDSIGFPYVAIPDKNDPDYYDWASAGWNYDNNQPCSTVSNKVLDMPLCKVGLSVKTYNPLKRKGYDTVGDVAKLSIRELKLVRNIGKVAVQEIIDKFAQLGVYF